MIQNFFRYCLLLLSASFLIIKAGYIDNRDLPLWSFPFHVNSEKPSAFQSRLFFLTARNAFDWTGGDQNNYGKGCSISDLYGSYNLARVAKQLELAGYDNPLQEDFKALTNIPFDSKGRISGVGVWFGWYQAITEQTFFGLDFSVLNASAESKYVLKKSIKLALGNNLTDSIVWQLYRDRQEVNEELHLTGEQCSVSGFSDIDLFFGVKRCFDYCLKLRSLNLSARFGTILPVGQKNNILNPVSISFSGSGKYGFYGRLDANAEICEDWNISFWLELLGRTSICQKNRSLVNKLDDKQSSNIGVPQAYAPIISNIKVDPGITFGLGVLADFAYLRDGWGLNGGYTIIHHAKDDWTLLGKPFPEKPISFSDYNQLTSWDAEWVTVGLFFNPMLSEQDWSCYLPVFYFDWSIPVNFLIANNVPKTNRISIGFEFNF